MNVIWKYEPKCPSSNVFVVLCFNLKFSIYSNNLNIHSSHFCYNWCDLHSSSKKDTFYINEFQSIIHSAWNWIFVFRKYVLLILKNITILYSKSCIRNVCILSGNVPSYSNMNSECSTDIQEWIFFFTGYGGYGGYGRGFGGGHRGNSETIHFKLIK